MIEYKEQVKAAARDLIAQVPFTGYTIVASNLLYGTWPYKQALRLMHRFVTQDPTVKQAPWWPAACRLQEALETARYLYKRRFVVSAAYTNGYWSEGAAFSCPKRALRWIEKKEGTGGDLRLTIYGQACATKNFRKPGDIKRALGAAISSFDEALR